MAEVDPYVINIPRAFLVDPELRAWFEYDNRWKHDIWIRTGGGEDAIAGEANETDSLNNQTDILQAITANLQDQINDIDREFDFVANPVKQFRAITKNSNYTAIDHDFINAKQRAIITFPRFPGENSVIIVRNGDGSRIKLLGNGRNINGCASGFIAKKGTAIKFHYFIDDNEWFAV